MSMMLAIVVYQHTQLVFHRPSHSEDMAYYYYYFFTLGSKDPEG